MKMKAMSFLNVWRPVLDTFLYSNLHLFLPVYYLPSPFEVDQLTYPFILYTGIERLENMKERWIEISEVHGPQRSPECTAMKAIFSQNTVNVVCKKT